MLDALRAFLTACFALSAMTFFAGTARSQSLDWLIVPGERVGPLTASTSETMLAEAIGRDNVQRVDVYLGEGFTAPGTAVYPDDPHRQFEIIWRDDTRAAPKEVRLRGRSSAWHTREGLTLGSRLKEIERLNGRPFRLRGFGWDGGGGIVDSDRGRLKMLDWAAPKDSQTVPELRLLFIRLKTDESAFALPQYGQVQGERAFSSGHAAMQEINPYVFLMSVVLNP